MPEPCNRTGDDAAAVVAGTLLDAMDEAAVAADLVALLHWAALGMRGGGTGALVRGAMIAQLHLEALHGLLQEARNILSDKRDAAPSAGDIP